MIETPDVSTIKSLASLHCLLTVYFSFVNMCANSQVQDKEEEALENNKNIPFTLLGAGLLWVGWSGWVLRGPA